MLSRMLSRVMFKPPVEAARAIPKQKPLEKKTKKEEEEEETVKPQSAKPEYIDENSRIVKINDIDILVDDSVDPKRTNYAYSSEEFEAYLNKIKLNTKHPKLSSTIVNLFMKKKSGLTDVKRTIVGYY